MKNSIKYDTRDVLMYFIENEIIEYSDPSWKPIVNRIIKTVNLCLVSRVVDFLVTEPQASHILAYLLIKGMKDRFIDEDYLLEKNIDDSDIDLLLMALRKKCIIFAAKLLNKNKYDLTNINCWMMWDLSQKIEVVKLMLNHGYDVNEMLRYASIKSSHEILQLCLDRGANIHYDKEHPLRMSCRYGSLMNVVWLIEKGALVEGYEENQRPMLNALLNTDANDSKLLVKYLMTKGAIFYKGCQLLVKEFPNDAIRIISGYYS